MILIHPICEETIKPHYGNLVCAVMHDGTHHYGILNGMAFGQLILNDDSPIAETLSATDSKEKTKSKTIRGGKSKYKVNNTNKAQTSNKAQISAFGFGFGSPFGLGSPFGFGRRTALDLAAIALLFAVIL